jgi:hypothetical protein
VPGATAPFSGAITDGSAPAYRWCVPWLEATIVLSLWSLLLVFADLRRQRATPVADEASAWLDSLEEL